MLTIPNVLLKDKIRLLQMPPSAIEFSEQQEIVRQVDVGVGLRFGDLHLLGHSHVLAVQPQG
jgi:hypothetical protein